MALAFKFQFPSREGWDGKVDGCTSRWDVGCWGFGGWGFLLWTHLVLGVLALFAVIAWGATRARSW